MVIFSATWLIRYVVKLKRIFMIRYVEKLKRIFMNSKPQLTAVNFPIMKKICNFQQLLELTGREWSITGGKYAIQMCKTN